MGIKEWWQNERSWVISGTSTHLFPVFQGFLERVSSLNTSFIIASKDSDNEEFGEFYMGWTTLLIPPTTLLVINIVGVTKGVPDALQIKAWDLLSVKVLFALWVKVHLYPFLKGLLRRKNKTPAAVVM